MHEVPLALDYTVCTSVRARVSRNDWYARLSIIWSAWLESFAPVPSLIIFPILLQHHSGSRKFPWVIFEELRSETVLLVRYRLGDEHLARFPSFPPTRWWRFSMSYRECSCEDLWRWHISHGLIPRWLWCLFGSEKKGGSLTDAQWSEVISSHFG